MPLYSQLALVALGSVCGGLARWGVGVWAGRWLVGGFPWPTLAINVLGSFVLGWLMTWIVRPGTNVEPAWLTPETCRLAIGVGFCGAFTTFSTFELETQQLLVGQHAWLAMGYVTLSVALGFIALRAGIWLAQA